MRPPNPVSSCRPISIHSSESRRGAATIIVFEQLLLRQRRLRELLGVGPDFPDSGADGHVERLSGVRQPIVFGRTGDQQRAPVEPLARTVQRISSAMPLDCGAREPAVALPEQAVDMSHDSFLELTVVEVDR